MTTRPVAAATERNSGPILGVLRHEFRDCTRILEIGSGTGQHAIAFVRALPHLIWQTSDLVENHAGIEAWLKHAGLPNVRSPIELDVTTADLGSQTYDGVYSANTAHIMGLAAVEKMFALAGHVLRLRGAFCLYGPFRRNGKFSTTSNAAFDESLRLHDPAMGIRDLEQLDAWANAAGLSLSGMYAMPANNLLVVWRNERMRR